MTAWYADDKVTVLAVKRRIFDVMESWLDLHTDPSAFFGFRVYAIAILETSNMFLASKSGDATPRLLFTHWPTIGVCDFLLSKVFFCMSFVPWGWDQLKRYLSFSGNLDKVDDGRSHDSISVEEYYRISWQTPQAGDSSLSITDAVPLPLVSWRWEDIATCFAVAWKNVLFWASFKVGGGFCNWVKKRWFAILGFVALFVSFILSFIKFVFTLVISVALIIVTIPADSFTSPISCTITVITLIWQPFIALIIAIISVARPPYHHIFQIFDCIPMNNYLCTLLDNIYLHI